MFAFIARPLGLSSRRIAIGARALIDDRIDISSERNGSILKRVVRGGYANKGHPQPNDEVQLAWKIYNSAGNLVHSNQIATAEEAASSKDKPKQVFIFTDAETGEDISSSESGTEESEEPEPFTFRLGAEPREVIMGWEMGIQTMFEGEVAVFDIVSELAFGVNGVPRLVGPNESIKCELEVLKILPSPTRTYRSVGEDESIRDELMEKIQSGETPIAEEAMDRTPQGGSNGVSSSYSASSSSSATDTTEAKSTGEFLNEDGKKRKMFESSKHQLDPNQMVKGTGKGHIWEETQTSIDITIPLDRLYKKSELDIVIKSDRISVKLKDVDINSTYQVGQIVGGGNAYANASNKQVLFEGPLFGRIRPDESMWAIADADSESSFKGPHVQFSLEKSIGYTSIWASALNNDNKN